MSPAPLMNAAKLGTAEAPYGLPPPPRPGAPPHTAVPPSRRLACCRVISVTHTSAWPETIAAAARPSEPAAPPPPEVRVAANRTSGTPRTDATCAGSHELE
jgi:hypothetical protein